MDITIKFLLLASLLTLSSCRSIDKEKDSEEKKKDKPDDTESKEDGKNSEQPKSDTTVHNRNDGSSAYVHHSSGFGNDVLNSIASDNHLTGYTSSAASLEKLLGANGVGIGELPGSHQPNLGHGGLNSGLTSPVSHQPSLGHGGINEGLRPPASNHAAGHGNNFLLPGFHNGVTPGVLSNGVLRPGIGGLGNALFGGIGGFGLNGGQLGLLFGNVLLQAIANFIQNAQPIIANMAG